MEESTAKGRGKATAGNQGETVQTIAQRRRTIFDDCQHANRDGIRIGKKRNSRS